jgi:hypothetical protein
MELRWSTQAADDLERIFRRIQKDRPAAAREAITTIYNGCSELNRLPIAAALVAFKVVGSYGLAVSRTSWCTKSKGGSSRFPASTTLPRTGLESS